MDTPDFSEACVLQNSVAIHSGSRIFFSSSSSYESTHCNRFFLLLLFFFKTGTGHSKKVNYILEDLNFPGESEEYCHLWKLASLGLYLGFTE